ncbi:MAG: hypothetical protein KDB23_16630 [Planctomycetales bacterium]|nr:hypothetical protein [Planctomycetales bacterium]
MKFVEITGQKLARIVQENEIPGCDLSSVGVADDSVVRINEQGDIELRRSDCWDVIGGLLGDFRSRIRHETGMEWV